MSKKETTVVVPDDSALGVIDFKPLEPGTYPVAINSIAQVAIKGGINAGKPAFNVELVTEGRRIMFKLIPAWQVESDAPKAEKDWVRMSRVSFVQALGITNTELFVTPESLIGSIVKAVVDVKDNGPEYGEQNFIVKFVK